MWRFLLVLLVAGECQALQLRFDGHMVNDGNPWCDYHVETGDRASLVLHVSELRKPCREKDDHFVYAIMSAISGQISMGDRGYWEFYLPEMFTGASDSECTTPPNSLSLSIRDNMDAGEYFRHGDAINLGYYRNRMSVAAMLYKPDGTFVDDGIASNSGPRLSVGDTTGEWITGSSVTHVPTTDFHDKRVIVSCASKYCDDTGLFCFDIFRNVTFIGESMQIIHDGLIAGDANVDGVFDQRDLVQVAEASRHERGDLVSWSQGDWNADGVFDSLDLVAAMQTGRYGQPAMAATVPEPATIILLLFGLLLALTTHTKRQHRI